MLHIKTMGGVKACRICLVMGVKMYMIQGSLEENVKSILGPNIFYSLELPQYMCYECESLIKKFHRFREKCLIAQSILYNILQGSDEMTEYEIKCVDRKTVNLESNLSFYTTKDVIDISERVDIEEIRIKEEVTEDTVLDMLVEEEKEEVEEAKVLGENVENGDGNHFSDGYDEDDDIPLKFAKKENCHKKKPRKHKNNVKSKKTRLKVSKDNTDRVSQTRTCKKRKPENEDGLTVDEVAMLKDFVITKLSVEEQLAEVLKRKDSSNYKDSPFKCDICYKGFLQAETLKNHTVRHDIASGALQCAVCGSRFVSRRALALHAARHRARYTCRACAYRTVHRDQAKKHKQWHDGVTYKCQYCNEISTKLTSHLSHMRIKHPSEFLCNVCGYSFVSLKGVKMHKSRMHRDQLPDKEKTEAREVETEKLQESNLYCKECDVQFVTNEAWKRHMVTSVKHRIDLGNACRHCGDTFGSAQQLRTHRRTHAHDRAARAQLARARYVPRGRRRPPQPAHPPPPPPPPYPLQCEHCEEMIPNRSCHWKHYQRHHQDKKYPLSENNYICEICGKGFQAHAFLVYHKRTHSDQRPHACHLCYNTFKTKFGLQQHFKSHSGVRPFPCQQCGKAFSRSACRNLHVRHVHLRHLPQRHGQNDTES